MNRGSNQPKFTPQQITASPYAVLAQGISNPSQFRRADHNRGPPPLCLDYVGTAASTVQPSTARQTRPARQRQLPGRYF